LWDIEALCGIIPVPDGQPEMGDPTRGIGPSGLELIEEFLGYNALLSPLWAGDTYKGIPYFSGPSTINWWHN